MDIPQQNDQIRMAKNYGCPLCGMSGETDVRFNHKKDLMEYYCKGCKQSFYSGDYFNISVNKSIS